MSAKEFQILTRPPPTSSRPSPSPRPPTLHPPSASSSSFSSSSSSSSSSFPPSLYIHARRPPTTHSLSHLLIQNLNVFVNLGGLQALLLLLYTSSSSSSSSSPPSSPSSSSTTHPPTLAFLRFSLRLLHLLRARLEPDLLQQTVFSIKETVPSLVLCLDEG